MSQRGSELTSQSDQVLLTKTWRAVEGTRTSAHTPEGVSVFSGEVLKELALRRLLVRNSYIKCKTSTKPSSGCLVYCWLQGQQ